MNQLHIYDDTASNLNRRVVSDRRQFHTQPFLNCNRKMLVSTYNAQTLSHSFNEFNGEAKERRLDAIAIQEHRICHNDNIQLWELPEDYTLITISATKNTMNASVGGVGLACQKKYVNCITNITKVSSRILRVDFSGNPATTVFSWHSPTTRRKTISPFSFITAYLSS